VKIFVSYSRKDAGDFANQIYESLMDEHQVFTDVNNIKPGDVWSKTIEKNISTCDRFVVIVTFAALRSSEVEKEVLQARKDNKKIIPCIYRDRRRDKIKWGLEKIQGIEFSDKYELARHLYSMIYIETTDKITDTNNDTTNKYPKEHFELASKTIENKNVSNIEHKNTDIINKTNLLPNQIKEKSDELRRKNEANNLLKNVNIFINEKKYQEAIECYDKILEIDPNNSEIRFWRIWVYHLANHKQDNLQEMNVSTDTNVLISKCVTLHREGKYQEAIECYDKALKSDPNNVYVLFYKGVVFSNQGKYQEAIECYDKILEIDPNNVDVLNYKGNALYDQKKYQEAIECYDKTLEVDSNIVEFLFNKGNALSKQRRYEKALEYYDKVLEIDPNYVDALNGKGIVFQRQNYFKEAIVWYDKALQIDPNHTLARKNRRYAKAGRILNFIFPG
jgi:tetratricopeptide (TPR) repeat protein